MQTTSVILLAVALNPKLAAKVLTDNIVSFAGDLDKECEKISVRLPVQCAGLLEVSKDGAVTFIHRQLGISGQHARGPAHTTHKSIIKQRPPLQPHARNAWLHQT